MRRRFVWTTLALVWTLVTALIVAAPSAAFAATPAKGKAKPKPAAAPPPGWSVDKVRFESLDAAGELDVAGASAYRGSVTVEPTDTGSGVSTINELGLDEYVRGIAEVPAGWPAEALKAQAIAARTYALNQLSANKQLCATDACQVYAGLAKERADVAGSWAQAVAATSGQVLLYKNAPILAMYSSSNGGQSVAGSRPYLRPVADPDDAVSPLHHWQSTVSFATLSSVFATPGPVIGIQKTDHDTYLLAWQPADGTAPAATQEVSTPDFVARLNTIQPAPAGLPLLLPSWRFDLIVDPVSTTVTFDGHGFGHGVGMSQYGALGKAERGMKAPDILAAYYGGLKPVQVPAQVLPTTVPVVVADNAASSQVTSPGRFRVLDGTGNVLATVASGNWTVAPAPGGKVRVVPPADQQAPLGVTPLSTVTESAVRIKFHVSLPALVNVTVQPPSGPPVAVPTQLLDAGDTETSVPVPLAPDGQLPDGSWTATIQADAGAGRTVAVPVAFTTGAAPPAAVPVADGSANGASHLPLIDLAAMAGPALPPSKHVPRWAIGLAILSLVGAVAVVARNAMRSFQSRFDPTLR